MFGRRSSWLDLPVTEPEAEVWRLRFDPNRLLTIEQIIWISRHSGAAGMLQIALKKLRRRASTLSLTTAEQELINLALTVTGARDLQKAYQQRTFETRSQAAHLRHARFHERQ